MDLTKRNTIYKKNEKIKSNQKRIYIAPHIPRIQKNSNDQTISTVVYITLIPVSPIWPL